jgi:serine/threonine protein kinase
MGATAAIHPTDQVLQSYGLGKLDDVSSQSVSKHLEGCESCQRRVAEISSDSFIGRLCGAQARPDPAGPVVSSLAGLSMLDAGSSSLAPPPTSTLPPGLADHPDYEVVRELGQGGMGTVYLGLNRLMGRHEVLKVVSSHLVKRSGVPDRFLGEIRNAARLHHTNIVTAYSAVRIGESIVFAMEYVDGLDLAKLVKAKGRLPVANACNYTHQAALGLQHAHELGMVHRDIKPSNLMLAKQGNRAVIKVLDFGLAKVKSEGAIDGGLTHEGQMLGTPDYIAPEQISDARGADIRADIYSLGCTLYCLLTGGPPFHATSLYEILQAHHSMEALPLNLARPEVPAELAALVARMMAKEPERRFQTPVDVAQALVPFFKKSNTALKGSNPEVSKAGQPEVKPRTIGADSLATQRATAAGTPSDYKQLEASRNSPQWQSLFEPKNSEPTSKSASTFRLSWMQKPKWLWPSVAAGMLLLGFIVAWMTVLRVRTSNGTIELVNLPKDAGVFVDGAEVSVIWPGGGKPAIVTLGPGRHKVTVKKDGLEISGEEVAVQAGGMAEFTVRPIPNDSSKSAKESQATVAMSAGTKAILDALETPIQMNFAEETPLDDVLKYIREKTKGLIKLGIPIYVDPIGLQEAEKSMTSTVRNIDLKDLPLNNTLPLVLAQLDLAYYVKDDVLIITSKESLEAARTESTAVVSDESPSNKSILEIVEIPIVMRFDEETPLEDVVNYLAKTAKRGEAGLAKRIYVDPIGLQEAEKSMTSTIRNLDLEGVPLKTTLRLLLKQLDLAFEVKGGMLIINSIGRIQKKPKEPAAFGGFGGDPEPENTQTDPAEPAKAEGLEGDAKKSRFASLFNGKDLTGWADSLQNGACGR